MAQFNKNQMHRKLERDIKVCYRVLKNQRIVAENRKDNQNPQRLVANWTELFFALTLALDTLQNIWGDLQEIRDEYARGTLDPADISELARARLDRVMATSNVLTNPQLNNGFTDVDFPSAAANTWEKFYEVNSCVHDTAVKLRSRTKYWREEWKTLQPDAEAAEMAAFLRRINVASNVLKVFCEDIANRDNNDRQLGVRKAALRKQVSRPGIDRVTGSLALLNTDDVDAGDPSNELQKVDPDLNYTRDIPELGTDTA